MIDKNHIREHVFIIMQTLKPEIREKILRVSEKFFYRHGFETATMRQIAEQTGMTVSNLYKYFKNKESIFDEIVKAYHAGYKKGFEEMINHRGEKEFDGDHIKSLEDALFHSVEDDRIKFVLLFDGSAGTKYAKFKEYVISALAGHMSKQAGNRGNEFAFVIFASNLINNTLTVARNYRDSAWARDNISMIVTYHMNGMKKFL
jgi:AcrR family transcriptional regulator